MQKTSALALLAAALLLVVPAGRAKTVVVRADWEKARTLLARGDFRPRVRVELKSAERVKGKLIEATGAGLRLEQRGSETLIAREDIRTIRLAPRKTTRYKNRLLGLLGGIPAGFGAGIITSLYCCFGDGTSGGAALGYTVLVGALIAVPYGFYELGARADRGAVLIVLDESTAKKPPVPPQAEQTSPAKEEQP